MSTQPFNKRTATPALLMKLMREVAAHRDDLRAARREGLVDRRFAEKIMLAVTQVNGCRWCNYGHTRAALAAGVRPEELQALMAQEIGQFPEEEAVALAFAQHYAESRDNPDPTAWQRVVDYYGAEKAAAILAYIRMITIGNLYGNTVDALLARLQGRPSPQSTLADELGLIAAPLALLTVPLLALGALARRAGHKV